MIYTIKCGEKIYILYMSVSIIDQMSCKILAYWIPAKNPTSCIPNLKPLKLCSCSLKQVQEYKLIKADLLYSFSLLPPLPAKSRLAVVTTMSLQCHISLTPDNQPHLLSAVKERFKLLYASFLGTFFCHFLTKHQGVVKVGCLIH